MTDTSNLPPLTDGEKHHILDLSTHILKSVQAYDKVDELTPALVISSFLFLIESGCSVAGMKKAHLSQALQMLLNNYTEENPLETEE